MKKIILYLLTLITPPVFVSAQIHVNSDGNLGIATTTPTLGKLQINQNGQNSGLVFTNNDSYRDFRFYKEYSFAYIMRGASTDQFLRFDNLGAIYIKAASTQDYANLITAKANVSLSKLWVVDLNSVHTFYVTGNGDVWHNGLHTLSDERFKQNISSLDNKSSINKIKLLKPVSYNMKENASFSSDSVDVLAMSLNSKAKDKKDFGFLAQDLEKVYPDLVSTTEDGVKAINYLGLIPVLVSALQEQNIVIEDLQTQIAKLNSNSQLKSGSSNTENSASTTISSAYLEQNTPNPFDKSTSVSMFIPEGIVSAQLCIYTLNGEQLESINVYERGAYTLVIEAETLKPGMYLYSLICDQQNIGTKQMIITK